MANTLPSPDSSWALFLDFDGTLVDLAPAPDAVTPAADLAELLTRIETRLNGALAVVSGRPIADIERQLSSEQAEALDAARQRLSALADAHAGLLLEDKQLALALHYRNAPELADQCRAAARQAAASARERLSLLDGKMVLELKPSGVDKGTVIEQLMTAAPFSGRVPVFIGDDVTDEYGFAAVNRLNGISIRVDDSSHDSDHDSPRPTQARYQIDSVTALLSWLRCWPD